jgi:hypothetical protein
MTLFQELLRDAPEKLHLELKAFYEGWHAFYLKYSELLIAHGTTDFRPGYKEDWEIYKEGVRHNDPHRFK